MKSTDETQQDHSQHVAEKLSETVEITQEEHRSALLTEYEMCELHTWKWDNATWQTAAIFLSAAIAGFIVVIQFPDTSHLKFLIVSIIGVSAILALLAWLAMIQRWDAYKRVVHFRLREIEQDLGLWHNRYLKHLAINKKLVRGRSVLVGSEDDKARLQRLEQAFPDYPGTAVISFIKLTTLGLILGWVGVIIIEFIFTFVR